MTSGIGVVLAITAATIATTIARFPQWSRRFTESGFHPIPSLVHKTAAETEFTDSGNGRTATAIRLRNNSNVMVETRNESEWPLHSDKHYARILITFAAEPRAELMH